MTLTSRDLHKDQHKERHWTCARRMSERRHHLGLTQHDVADRLAALGVPASNRQLSAMEHGQGVDVCRLPEIATALECTVTYLLGLTDAPGSWSPDGGRAPASAEGTRPQARSWILGPDIPDRPTAPPGEGRRA